MEINDVKWLANLSKLYFSDDELQKITEDMASIIELMDTLRDVEIPADSNVGYESAVLCDLRADDPTESLPPELLYSQSRSNNMIKEGFSIPKIIEE